MSITSKRLRPGIDSPHSLAAGSKPTRWSKSPKRGSERRESSPIDLAHPATADGCDDFIVSVWWYDALSMIRQVLLAVWAAGVVAGMAAAADAPKNAILELRRYQLRNSAENQRQRNQRFSEAAGGGVPAGRGWAGGCLLQHDRARRAVSAGAGELPLARGDGAGADQTSRATRSTRRHWTPTTRSRD